MSYNKETLNTGDVISSRWGNKIEDGIYNAHKNIESVKSQLNEITTYQTAKGVATGIILEFPSNFKHGHPITFIVEADNHSHDTTINGKPLYKPNTKTTPNLKKGKAVTVWYNASENCFFIKASAEGNAIAENVLAGKTFSNDDDIGVVGTMINNGSKIITPSTVNQAISKGYHDGTGYVKGDSNLKAENIKDGINIFGVVGNLINKMDFQFKEKNINYSHNFELTKGEKYDTSTIFNIPEKINGLLIYPKEENSDISITSESQGTTYRYLDINGNTIYSDDDDKSTVEKVTFLFILVLNTLTGFKSFVGVNYPYSRNRDRLFVTQKDLKSSLSTNTELSCHFRLGFDHSTGCSKFNCKLIYF